MRPLARLFVFTIAIWILTTAPWLCMQALLGGGNGVGISLMLGGVNTVAVVSCLLLWRAFLKRFRGLSAGLVLMSLYLLTYLGLVIFGFMVGSAVPFIWEGFVGPLVTLFPASQLALFLPFGWFLAVSILGGGVFYFFLGMVFEGVVFRRES
ncbi:MAG: hypothetical protein HYY59_00010 [Candidatus Omnitrophica bacterium]|nr:hypothetical protein [Candidatus Omnitrophota bacterium]